MGAASVRFLYACPFALAWLVLLTLGFGLDLPRPSAPFVAWIITGSIAQITFTFLLMWLFSFSNFTVGTALSKTEVIQVVVLEAILLRELISGLATAAVVIATAGVLIMTAGKSKLSVASLASGLRQKSTVIGLACGFFSRTFCCTVSRCCTVAGGRFDTSNVSLYPSSCNRVSEYRDACLVVLPGTRPDYKYDYPLAPLRHCRFCWMDSVNLLVHCLYNDQRGLCACPRPDRAAIHISSLCSYFPRKSQPQGNCRCHVACRRHRSAGH